MTEGSILFDLVVLFATALPIVFIFQRLNVPSVVGFLIAGIVIGPHGAGLIAQSADVESLADIGLVLLLFVVGLELSLSQLVRLGRIIVWAGSLQILLTGAHRLGHRHGCRFSRAGGGLLRLSAGPVEYRHRPEDLERPWRAACAARPPRHRHPADPGPLSRPDDAAHAVAEHRRGHVVGCRRAGAAQGCHRHCGDRRGGALADAGGAAADRAAAQPRAVRRSDHPVLPRYRLAGGTLRPVTGAGRVDRRPGDLGIRVQPPGHRRHSAVS